jgi:hypothetical protein
MIREPWGIVVERWPDSVWRLRERLVVQEAGNDVVWMMI